MRESHICHGCSSILLLLITFIEFELNKTILCTKFPLETMAEKEKKQLSSLNKGLQRPEFPWVCFIMSWATGITLQKPLLTNSNTETSVLKVNVCFVLF